MSPPPPPPLPPSPQGMNLWSLSLPLLVKGEAPLDSLFPLASGILDVIQVAMSSALGDPDFTTLLQTIKGHFYTRDYDAVFTQPLHLPVYAARYTPSRALGYLDLIDQHPQIQAVLQDGPSNVLCLGAGAGGEMVALLAAARRYSHPDQQLTLHIQDYVSWETSLMALEAASRAAWFSPETNHQVRVEYSVSNLLEPSDDLCARIEEAQLVTAMFVLNELFTDRASAMNLVRTLMKHLKPGSLFLVCD